jgi:hypothetical protein
MNRPTDQQKRGQLIRATVLFVLMTARYGWESQKQMGDFFDSENDTWLDRRNARLKSAAVNTAINLLACSILSDNINRKNMLIGNSWIEIVGREHDDDNSFLEGLVQIIDNLRNIKTSYNIQGPNYTDAQILAQELENVILLGVNVLPLAVEKLNTQMLFLTDRDLWVEDEDLKMLKNALNGEMVASWLGEYVLNSAIITDEQSQMLEEELKRDGIEQNGGRKRYRSKKMRKHNYSYARLKKKSKYHQ